MRTFLQLKPIVLMSVVSLGFTTLTAFAAGYEPATVEPTAAAPAAVSAAKPADPAQTSVHSNATAQAPADSSSPVLGDITTTIKGEPTSKEATDTAQIKTSTTENKTPATDAKPAADAKAAALTSPSIEVKQAESAAKPATSDATNPSVSAASANKNDESIGGVAKTVTASSSDASMPTNSEAIVGFAKDASLSAFTYDYKNYEGSLKKTSGFFTKEGWAEFQKALTASKNLDTVKKEQLAVNAQLDGPAILQKQEVVAGGGKVWRVDVPIKVSYSGNNNQLSQRLVVHLGIVPVGNEVNVAGIAITQFVTLPA